MGYEEDGRLSLISLDVMSPIVLCKLGLGASETDMTLGRSETGSQKRRLVGQA